MAKELRLGFAMGGGVSLGVFSGVALAETIKRVLLDRTKTGELTYGRVTLDVFSGASAGAMSLALMLRGLLGRSVEREARARATLEREHGEAFTGLDADRQADLVAAQAVQDFQFDVWAREVNLDRLLGEGGRSLEYEPGLLDRKAVEALARTHLSVEDGQDLASGCRLLSRRVLFACTLSNLTPVLASAKTEFPGAKEGFVGLNDGLRSSVHRELRVFDLHLEELGVGTPLEALDHPGRWCRYHLGPEQGGRLGDLRRRRTWAKISATAIACGAFPGAFEPVVLERAAYEYGGLWPEPLREAGLERHTFTYVDGGTFNNEPIREAFRMASFIDAQRRAEDPDADFDRLIVFVDPFVSADRPSFRVPVHQSWFLEDPNLLGRLDGVDLRRRTTLDRLLPHVGTLLGAVLDEARVVEADKVFQTSNRFEIRSGMRSRLDSVLAEGAADEVLRGLAAEIRVSLERSGSESMIPPGRLTLAGELRRVLGEEGGKAGLLRGLKGSSTTVESIEADPGSAPAAERGLWLRALTFILLDLAMDLEGKWTTHQLVAIAPFVDLRRIRNGGRPTEVKLPGAGLAGFAGFMSPVAGDFAAEAARYCAWEFLYESRVLRMAPPKSERPPIELEGAAAEAFRRDVERGVQRLAARAEEVLRTSHLIQVLPGLDGIIRGFLARFAGNVIRRLRDEPEPRTEYEFRLKLWDGSPLELDGRGSGKDLKPVQPGPGQPWQLITFASCDAEGNWTGTHVNPMQELEVDQAGWLSMSDKLFCRIPLPDARLRARADLLGYPRFEVQLAEADRDRVLASGDWIVTPGTVPLEAVVFG